MGRLLCENNVPSVLSPTHRLAANGDALFTPHNSKRDDRLDLRIHRRFFGIVLLVLVRIHANIVEGKLLLNAVLEQLPLLQRQAVGFRDDGDDVDGLGEFLEHDDVDGFEGVAGGRDEVEAAVDARVLDVSATTSVNSHPAMAVFLMG